MALDLLYCPKILLRMLQSFFHDISDFFTLSVLNPTHCLTNLAVVFDSKSSPDHKTGLIVSSTDLLQVKIPDPAILSVVFLYSAVIRYTHAHTHKHAHT